MKFDKSVLYRFNMPYALGWMEKDGRRCVVAATEDHGPIVISPPPYTHASVLVDGPGGCMSLVSHPALPGELFAIMGCFLGYQFHGGAVYRIAARGNTVESEKIAGLPFAHRMEVVQRQGLELIVANLAAVKDGPADWSQAGSVYSLPLGPESAGLNPLLSGIHKNHGFLKAGLHGTPSLLISGAEGVFAADLEAPRLVFERVLGHEVSELALYDLDGDGQDELITIEPFHGNILAVYRIGGGAWTRVWQAELDYGHCVLADTIFGRPSILVSNRAGGKDLLLFQFPSTGALEPDRIVIESGVGAANMLVARSPEGDIIVATNQAQGELVRYSRS